MNRKKAFLLAGIGLLTLTLILVAGAAYLLLAAQPPSYHGTVFAPPRSAQDFSLQSERGALHLGDFRGKIVLLYFGYTHCPDECPATLAKVSQAFKDLGDPSGAFQLIFVSVDPARDTPEILANYVHAFNPSFIGATGPADQISTLAAAYGIDFENVPGSAASYSTISHTAVVLVIDRHGNEKLIWPADMQPAEMLSDMRALLKS